jgi:carbonic anhydrase
MVDKKFVTVINCIDGRVQIPIIEWMKHEYKIDYVDMITEAGPNKILAEQRYGLDTPAIKKKVEISIKKHSSNVIAVTGHYDCAGNPANKEKQIQQIKESVETVKSWGFNVPVIGLWIDDHWTVNKIL